MHKNSSTKYYQKNKEKFQKKVRWRHQGISEEEKNKKREYGCKQYKISKNMKSKH